MRNPLQLEHESTKIILVGMSGFGKTLHANHFVFTSNYDHYFIFDHDRQFSQRNKLTPAMNAAELLQQLRQNKRKFVVFDPSEVFSDMTEAFEWFARYAYKLSERLPGTKLLYCDEIQDNVGTGTIGDYTRRVFTSGRNRGLDFIGMSLQYNMIHNSIRGQATQTVAFMTNEKIALKDLVDRGFNADEIAALKPGQYVMRNKKGQEVRGKVPGWRDDLVK